MSLFHKPGIVNVRMVITEEKILSNIDKVQKLINPNSKKQIVELEEDTYFKDLIESIKMYLIEYPKKKNFPKSVYKSAYSLVEYATTQFEENTKQIESLIRQREVNIGQAGKLKELLAAVEEKEEGWKEKLEEAQDDFPEDLIETLSLIGRCKTKTSENCADALKLVNARINNLEANLHIEIDMERIEDRSKALSYIGIEVAEALKGIPTPTEEEKKEEKVIEEVVEAVDAQYMEETRVEVKPSLWERIKKSKVARALTMMFRIRIRIDMSNALPEGKEENK